MPWSADSNKRRRLTPGYYSWHGMIERCCYSGHPQFKDYGGRGITVYFITDTGLRPSSKHSIDRIDNDGHSSPAIAVGRPRKSNL
jgi:hypothetical protein